jgi:putative ABC transport system permease protein
MAVVIVASVGVGIGATTTVFSAVNAALLRPLPYADPGRLVRIYTDSPPNRFPLSVADFRALQAQQTRFEQIAGFGSGQATFTDGIVAERVRGRYVSPGYFALLGIQPALGRLFTSGDGGPGGPRVVAISYGFWQRWFGGREDAIGRTARLDGADYTLIGVLPQAVGPLEQRQDYFIPVQWPEPPRKGPFFITALGRLGADANRADAGAELRGINRRIFPVWRASYQDDRATWSMMDVKAFVVGDVGAMAGLALTAVGLVWLIACANASNLLIARIASRRRELAVRAALGASRARIVRHLLVESALLAGAAALVGAGLAWIGVGALRRYGAAYVPRTQEVALDRTAIWVLVALTASSALLFGLVPALHGSGGRVDEALRAEGRSSTGHLGVRRLRRALVGAQFMIATPLLVVGALLVVSLSRLGRVDLGFDARNVLTAQLTLPGTPRMDADKVAASWEEIRRRISGVAGVSGVAFADGRPPNDVNNFNNFDLEDAPTPPGHSQPVTPWVDVSPDYFRVLGLPLLDGRLLDGRDSLPNSPPVVVVDRAWGRRFFPRQSAVGRHLREGGCTTCPMTTVVGVVSDVKYAGLDKPDEGTVYAPMAPERMGRSLIIRTSADPAAVVGAVRQAIREVNPTLPLYNVATVDELVERSLDRPRSLSMLIGGLAISALVLSIIGIYGVMAYHVHQHTKEIGIRIALGGSRRAVLGLIVGQGMRTVGVGVAVGLLAAVSLARLTASLFFGVGAGDPATLAGVCALLLGTALMACLIPALRVTALEPGSVLRE